jgi:hypothetical protein
MPMLYNFFSFFSIFSIFFFKFFRFITYLLIIYDSAATTKKQHATWISATAHEPDASDAANANAADEYQPYATTANEHCTRFKRGEERGDRRGGRGEGRERIEEVRVRGERGEMEGEI